MVEFKRKCSAVNPKLGLLTKAVSASTIDKKCRKTALCETCLRVALACQALLSDPTVALSILQSIPFDSVRWWQRVVSSCEDRFDAVCEIKVQLTHRFAILSWADTQTLFSGSKYIMLKLRTISMVKMRSTCTQSHTAFRQVQPLLLLH